MVEWNGRGPQWLPGASPIRDCVFDLCVGEASGVAQKLRGAVVALTEARSWTDAVGSEVGWGAISASGRDGRATTVRVRRIHVIACYVFPVVRGSAGGAFTEGANRMSGLLPPWNRRLR